MSLVNQREDGAGDAGASSILPGAQEAAWSARVPVGIRDTFIGRRNAIIGELSKCYEDGVVIGRMIQVLPIVASLPETFRFQDALGYACEGLQDMTAPNANELKTKISQRIQSIASKAERHCENADATMRYMQRLERQFNATLGRLIEEEQKGCAQKVEGLCERLDTVLQDLSPDVHGEIANNVEELKAMTSSLRRYTRLSLLADVEKCNGIELTSEQCGAPFVAVPVKEFFERLNSSVVVLLNRLSDHGAA